MLRSLVAPLKRGRRIPHMREGVHKVSFDALSYDSMSQDVCFKHTVCHWGDEETTWGDGVHIAPGVVAPAFAAFTLLRPLLVAGLREGLSGAQVVAAGAVSAIGSTCRVLDGCSTCCTLAQIHVG